MRWWCQFQWRTHLLAPSDSFLRCHGHVFSVSKHPALLFCTSAQVWFTWEVSTHTCTTYEHNERADGRVASCFVLLDFLLKHYTMTVSWQLHNIDAFYLYIWPFPSLLLMFLFITGFLYFKIAHIGLKKLKYLTYYVYYIIEYI